MKQKSASRVGWLQKFPDLATDTLFENEMVVSADNPFFEILAIPILKIYRGFPYQFFDFLDIREFLTNFDNSDFEIELFLAKKSCTLTHKNSSK